MLHAGCPASQGQFKVFRCPVLQMAQANVGSVIVLKGEDLTKEHIAGIITERGVTVPSATHSLCSSTNKEFNPDALLTQQFCVCRLPTEGGRGREGEFSSVSDHVSVSVQHAYLEFRPPRFRRLLYTL